MRTDVTEHKGSCNDVQHPNLPRSLGITYLARTGLNDRDRHMANCTTPYVAPKAAGFGANAFTNSMLILLQYQTIRICNRLMESTHENPMKAALTTANRTAIPIQSLIIVNCSGFDAPGSIPALATVFNRGKVRNGMTQSFILKW